MHNFPVRTTGQDFLHSCRHFYNGQTPPLPQIKDALTFGLHYQVERLLSALFQPKHDGEQIYLITVDNGNSTTQLATNDPVCRPQIQTWSTCLP